MSEGLENMFDSFERYLSGVRVLGEVMLQVKSGSELCGFGDDKACCSLSEFNIIGFHYQADVLLCSLTLSKGFPVCGDCQSLEESVEIEYECVNIELKYCILRHCIVEVETQVVPANHLQDVSFVALPCLEGG
jgi:hypothetical protein